MKKSLVELNAHVIVCPFGDSFYPLAVNKQFNSSLKVFLSKVEFKTKFIKQIIVYIT